MPPTITSPNVFLTFLQKAYVCPSCRSQSPACRGIASLTRPSTLRKHFKQPKPLRTRRSVSTITQSSAVHAPRSIPPAFKRLDESLNNLGREAFVYVDTSQLRLAQRGLESENAVTRVAVLGVGARAGAARLTKALLADPLSSELEWERQLAEEGDQDGRALLLRYGEKASIDDRHPLIKTLSVPSSVLYSHNLEILVSGISPERLGRGASSPLVPSLDIRNSFSGQPTTITYPAHKTLIYTSGLDRIVTLNEGSLEFGKAMVRGVVDASWFNLEQPGKSQIISAVNLESAVRAIGAFRTDIEKSVEFEQAWFDSGLAPIASWILDGTAAPTGQLKASVANLTELMLREVELRIGEEEAVQKNDVGEQTLNQMNRDNLNRSLAKWAENAHTELRNRLNGAFWSKSWDRTRWWKMLWRVDEIEMIATEVLQRAWLVDAEKENIWLYGRVFQSGLVPVPAVQGMGQESQRDPDLAQDLTPFDPETEKAPALHAWPQDIQFARQALIRNTALPLQALAQKLFFQSTSTTVLASAISALLYVSVSSTSAFEAAAIAALGLVYSMRRLQKKWELARVTWEETVRENAKRVLRRCEEGLSSLIQNGGRAPVDDVAVQRLQSAKEAVEQARTELSALQEKESL